MSDRRVDQLTTVNPSLTDLIMLIQNGEAVNTTFARIRNLIVGSGSLETAAIDIIAALNEVNTKASNNATNITNLKNKIGTGDFSTTSQNAVGAVAELKEGVDNLTESVATNAQNIADNTASLNANTQNIADLENNKQDKIEDSGWIKLPLTRGNAVSGYEPSYRKIGNIVSLRGRYNGINSIGDIATLPSGFRSTATLKILTGNPAGNGVYSKYTLNANGVINLAYHGATLTENEQITLDGIIFMI